MNGDAENMPVPEDRLIVFLDILGFKHLLRQGDVGLIVETLRRCREVSAQSKAESMDFKLHQFSDSIIMSARIKIGRGNYGTITHIFAAIRWLAIDLLLKGVLVRGGVTIGKMVHTSDMGFGEGIVRAYHLEDEVAVFPRIIVDESVFEQVKGAPSFSGFNHVLQDQDGLHYVHIFEPLSMKGVCPRYHKESPIGVLEIIIEKLEGSLKDLIADQGSDVRSRSNIGWALSYAKRSLAELEPSIALSDLGAQ